MEFMTKINEVLFGIYNNAGEPGDFSEVSHYVELWVTAIISGIAGLAATWFLVNTIVILIRAQNYNRKGEPERRAEALSSLWWNVLLFVGLAVASGVSGILAGVVFS